MGEYASIMIGDYNLYSFKNYLNNDFVSLFFSKNNLIVKKSTNDPAIKYEKCSYISTIKQVKERFDCLGYGLSNFKKLFDNLEYDDFEYDYELLERINYSETKLQEIRNKKISFKKWFNSLSKYLNYKIKNNDSYSYNDSYYQSDLITTFCDRLLANSLINGEESLYGILFSVNDIIPYVYRAILEFFNENESVELDFTDLQY